MRKIVLATAILAMSVGLAPLAQDNPQAIVTAAAQAMGAATLTSIQFSGTGTINTFGQNWKNEVPWPEFKMPAYSVSVDFATPAMQVTLTRDNPDKGKPMQGGGFPLLALARVNQAISGKTAWNVAGTNNNAAPAAVNDRTLELWTSSPQAVIKAAQAAGANVKAEAVKNARGEPTGAQILTFPAPVGNTTFKVNVTKDNLVSRVEYTTDTPMLGDTIMAVLYSQVKDFGGGFMFPARIVRIQGSNPALKLDGFPIMTLTVDKAAPNAKVAIEVPANVQAAASTPPAAPPAVTTEKLAEGVFFLSGQGANSVAIEMADHIILVEAPAGDALATARFEAARKAIPNKPVRIVVNTHHHFDHAGGVRAAVAEGATVVTSGWNRLFYEKIMAAPHTLNPDRLSKEQKKATFEYVGTDFGQEREVHEITDGKRKVQVYRVAGSQHSDAMLVVYLPAEKILIEADMYTPAAAPVPGAAAPVAASAGAGIEARLIINPEPRILYNNIERLKVQVETIAPLHGRVVKIAELMKELGE